MGAWGGLVGDETYMAGDCPGASECTLLMRDIWNLRHGKARVAMAPLVNTAYSAKDWGFIATTLPLVDRRTEKVAEENVIDWDDAAIPRSVVCVPSRTDAVEVIQKEAIWGSPGTVVDPLYESLIDEGEADASV